jgi:hypothetical protein
MKVSFVVAIGRKQLSAASNLSRIANLAECINPVKEGAKMADWKAEIRQRLVSSHLPPAREAALVEELAQDLADCYEALLAGGASEAEAYQQTIAELNGGESLICKSQREAGKQESIIPEASRRKNMLADFWRELRYSARTLTKNKGFTIVAVSSLALGFALVATTLAVVNAYLIRSMPFPAADRLYHVIYTAPGAPEPRGVATLDWKSLSDVVEAPDASQLARFTSARAPKSGKRWGYR